jgi:glycosyltransferase involved in cell wall biosynthesis
VVSVGRLIGVKNPAAVLHGFRRAASQSGQLRFIGDGDLREQLLRERAAAGLDHCVSFSGVIPRDDVYRQLAGADLFVSASRGEGLPVAALEAMACRCPVILSDIEPHREIADGASFIPLIAPDDIEGLAREIRRFAEMSPAARSQVARQCRSLVEERFSLGAMHAGYGKIYRQALAAA